jgi:hypothetical protein
LSAGTWVSWRCPVPSGLMVKICDGMGKPPGRASPSEYAILPLVPGKVAWAGPGPPKASIPPSSPAATSSRAAPVRRMVTLLMPCPAAAPSALAAERGRRRPPRRVRTPEADRQTLVAGSSRRWKPLKYSAAWTRGAMPRPSPAPPRGLAPQPRAISCPGSAGPPRPSGLSHKSHPKAIQRPTEHNPPIPTPPCRNADRAIRTTRRRSGSEGQAGRPRRP